MHGEGGIAEGLEALACSRASAVTVVDGVAATRRTICSVQKPSAGSVCRVLRGPPNSSSSLAVVRMA